MSAECFPQTPNSFTHSGFVRTGQHANLYSLCLCVCAREYRDWTLFLLHALQAPLCLFLPKLFQRVGILWKQIESGRLCHGATPGFAKQRARQREKGKKKWIKGKI